MFDSVAHLIATKTRVILPVTSEESLQYLAQAV